jgi:hypothetical protein
MALAYVVEIVAPRSTHLTIGAVAAVNMALLQSA